ncbi:MAG: AraC family transcriptional regulator [bacterium]|nr:AraC family transcriptional regulator [bacterium]
MNKDIAQKAQEMIWSSGIRDFDYLNVNWISDKLGVSPSYLSTVFKEVKGMSINDFLRGHKACLAMRMLKKEKNLPIKNIACYLGYSDSQNFIAMFKKFYGITPDKYRKYLAK